MRIAIVSGDDVVGEDPEQLGAALAAQGHDVTTCLRRAGRRRGGSAPDGYRRVSVPVGPRDAAAPVDVLPYVGDWAGALERIWSKDRPDVVHAYGWLGGLAAQLAARRRHIPTVQSFWAWPRRRAATTANAAPNANASSRCWPAARTG